ncbi:MAG: PA0069 family radical SAM protein [Planctomycetota bacterium]
MRYGAKVDPPNRFESIHVEWDSPGESSDIASRVNYFEDGSKSIVSENRSPDLPFRYSVNPYRGCIHGCAYCYARPTHEYLGLNAGLDFETKIIVKKDAPRLLRQFLAKPSYSPEPIAFSGVTDCYQPAERQFRLTRGCLEVADECRQPVGIVTKNALVCRDLDLLSSMARRSLVHVYVSITTLRAELAAELEPRTSTPAARLRTIQQLAAADVPVGVMTAPVIPGLNDSELPDLLRSARDAGATVAGYVLLRLPLTVEPVFMAWLDTVVPDQAERIRGRILATRDGATNQSEFGRRMVGTGELAEQIRGLFKVFRSKFGYADSFPARRVDLFRRPKPSNGQLELF